MHDFVRILIDTDPERHILFKVLFDLDDFKSVTVEFRKNKSDCINLSLAELESLGYADANGLLQSVLSSRYRENLT